MNRSVQLVIAVSLPVLVISLGSLFVLDRLEHPGSTTATETLPAEKTVRIAVYNGCGRPGLAATFAEFLRGMGYDVVNGVGENADAFDYPVSAVVDRSGNSVAAQQVAMSLGIDVVLEQRASDPYLIEDVHVILGRDWNTLKPVREE